MFPIGRHIRLRDALLLVVLLPLLAVFGAGGYGVLTTLEAQLESRLEDDIALIARTLKEPLGRSLEARRRGSLNQALRSASEIDRVYGIYLYDVNGKLLAEAGRRSAQDAPEPVAIDTSDEAQYGSVGGRRVYSYFTPLNDSAGQVIGMLQVTRRASEIREYLESLRWHVALITLVACALFAIIIAAGMHLCVGRPLRNLGEAMVCVGSGDRSARALATGPREIRGLADRFNQMLDGIAERDRRLASERERQLALEGRLRHSEQYALIGRLASGVAHELGAPLSVVDGQAQRLQRRQRSNSEESAMLAQIRNSVSRMTAILHRLLGFGRESRAPAKRVTWQHLITLAIADVRALADVAGSRIEIQTGPDDAGIRGDGGRLREAIVHLLRNAVQAAPGGNIRIGWRSDDDSEQIYVENSGEPLSAAVRERLFDPFFTTKTPGDGSGLGLAIVRGTVIDHGGQITVYDSALGGAGFRLEFP